MLKTESTTHDKLDTMEGRLTHLAAIIPQILHFLSRLRQLRDRAQNRRQIMTPAAIKDDLLLMAESLKIAKLGVNMNLITYRLPSHVYRSDACPAGLGGYSSDGRAWRFAIPPHLQFRATLNFLEWLACQIGPLVDIKEGNMPRLSCVLSMTDSTTAAGWLRKSNFKEDDEGEVQLRLKRETARNFAVTTMKQEIKLYSQWFPGERNEVTDSLSRDFHIPTQRLTNLLRHAAPSQVPPNFSISALPQKISSWVGALLQQLPASTQGKENHQKSKLLLGRSGDTFSEASNLTTTTSSNTLPNHNALSSSPALPKPHESHTILQALTAPWLSAQSEDRGSRGVDL